MLHSRGKSFQNVNCDPCPWPWNGSNLDKSRERILHPRSNWKHCDIVPGTVYGFLLHAFTAESCIRYYTERYQKFHKQSRPPLFHKVYLKIILETDEPCVYLFRFQWWVKMLPNKRTTFDTERNFMWKYVAVVWTLILLLECFKIASIWYFYFSFFRVKREFTVKYVVAISRYIRLVINAAWCNLADLLENY